MSPGGPDALWSPGELRVMSGAKAGEAFFGGHGSSCGGADACWSGGGLQVVLMRCGLLANCVLCQEQKLAKLSAAHSVSCAPWSSLNIAVLPARLPS